MNKRKFMASTVATLIAFGSLSTTALAFNDLNNHWAKEEVNELAGLGIIKGYEDNSFKPDQKVLREEAAAILSRYIGDVKGDKTGTLSDINGRWSQQDIEKLITWEIVKGYPDNTFKPENEITRAEFVKMISMILPNEITGTDEVKFTDIENHWAEVHIDKLAKAKIVKGYDNRMFKPDETITRAEVAKLVCDTIKYLGEENNNGNNNSNSNNNTDITVVPDGVIDDEKIDITVVPDGVIDDEKIEVNKNINSSTQTEQYKLGYKDAVNLETPGVAKYGDIARITIGANEMIKVEEAPENANVKDADFLNILPLRVVDIMEEHSRGSLVGTTLSNDRLIESAKVDDEIFVSELQDILTRKDTHFVSGKKVDYVINSYNLSNPEIEKIKWMNQSAISEEELNTGKDDPIAYPQNLEEFNKGLKKYGEETIDRQEYDIYTGSIYSYSDSIRKDRDGNYRHNVRADNGEFFEISDGFPMKVKIEVIKKSTGEKKIYYVTFRIKKNLYMD